MAGMTFDIEDRAVTIYCSNCDATITVKWDEVAENWTRINGIVRCPVCSNKNK